MSIQDNLFFVVIQGKPSGPFSFQEVVKMNLKPAAFIRTSEMKDFKELREIPSLCDVLDVDYEPALPQYFATMDLRLLAWAIDFLFSFSLFCIFIFLPILFFSSPENKMQFTVIGLIAVLPIQFMISVGLESSFWQGSVGKIILKIKVCDERGLRISFTRSFTRNVAKTLGFLSLGLGFFMGFFDRKQQCWHDKLAGTYVIKDRLI